MRVLVCGSRDWDDQNAICEVLQGIYDNHDMGYLVTHVSHLTIIEGGAKGADACAAWWATTPGPHPADTALENKDICSVLHEQYKADWTKHGKRAGPLRNQQMLDIGQPDVVWAFVNKPLAESRGTADMVGRAKKAGIRTYVVEGS